MKIGLILLAAGSLFAQDGNISGPTSGFVFDHAARSLRPVLGVPGASTIGAPLRASTELTAAWVSPGLDFEIARGGDGSLRLYRLNNGDASEAGLDGTASGPQDVIYSPRGRAALLTTSAGAIVLAGLPDRPRVAGKVDVPGYSHRGAPRIPGGVNSTPRLSTAVSDDGAYVLVANGGVVRVVTTSGENRRLADASDAAVAFAPESHDAAVADAASGVAVYRNLDGAPSLSVLAAQEDFGSPGGVAFSNDGKRVFVAASKARGVIAYDASNGAKSLIACECSPSLLVRMGDVFRLNEFGGDPLWMLDAARSEPQIVFVPALAPQ